MVTSGTARVPSTIDGLDAEWLTAVLRADETTRDTALPERSRQLCMRLVERAVATIDDIDAVEVFE